MSVISQKSWAWFSQALTQHNSFSAYLQPLIQLFAPHWTTDAYRARIVEIRDEADDMYTLVLQPQQGFIDRIWPNFKAGQFIELMVEKDGARTLRCFSISSSPAYYKSSGLIELSIRIQQKGRITPWIHQQMATNDVVNISAAQGDFLLPEAPVFGAQDSGAQQLLLIAGGSGITPFRSMLQQLALNKSAAFDIHLLYYSRNDQQIVFKQELEALKNNNPHIEITFIDSEKHGFISEQHIESYCPDFNARKAFICGPSPMIQQARKVLSNLGLAKENINFEFFGVAPIEIENSEQGAVHFQVSNKVVLTEKDQAKTLLQQAEDEGLTPVVGCRIGVCHQCICKKKSGVVFNTRTQKYSDTGSEEIQLCISVAQGDVVLDL